MVMIKAVPSRTICRRPLMVRQPYSEAVKSDRRSGLLFFPEVSVPRKRGTEGGLKTIEEDREERWSLP